MMAQLIEFVVNHPVLVGIFVILLITLLVTESRKGAASITSNELTEMVNKQKAVVIDIRDIKEFKTGHIVDAIHIPRAKIKENSSKLNKYKEQPIILVDAAGQHSGAAAAQLKENGFAQLFRLRGGIGQWVADSLPLVKQ